MIALLHGWGYDRRAWDAMTAALGDLPVRHLDLGFFGTPQLDLPAVPYLGVGHSLGFLWLLREAGSACRGLVAVNGFPRFTEAVDFQPAVPPRLLARMQQQFVRQPAAVLSDFQQRCGAPGPEAGLQVDRLQTGLAWLQDWDLRAQLRDWRRPLTVLASRQDKIVPAAMTGQAFAGHAVQWHETADHALPMQAADWTAARIRQVWMEIQRG
jgi:pimeloyl-[acyl-carrier protein] methyl ester esterase